MKRVLCLLFIIFYLSLSSVEYETASLKDFIYGSTEATSYDNWISHVIEGDGHSNYAYAPFDEQSTDFGEYQVPTQQQRAVWNSIVDYFMAGLFAAADEVITFNNFPYEIVEFTDQESGKELMILRELIDTTYVDSNQGVNGFEEIGAFYFGWGTFILDLNSQSNKIINVVHPSDDFIAPVIATHAFLEGDFKWLLLNGASRGALMNGYISVSDPSREFTHPFNYIYEKICQQINQTHQHKVHSIQLHSYDYNTSQDVKNVHFSNKSYYPTLPIYDYSSQQNSIIQQSPYQIHPLLSFGNIDPINVDDYYSIYSPNSIDFSYDLDGEEVPILSSYSYGGYPQNVQYYLTYADGFAYDVLGRFLHIELAEKPKHFDTFEEYKKFYAYNVGENQYNFDERFTQAIEFYQPFIDALVEVYSDIDQLDDGLSPTPVSNLTAFEFGTYDLRISWSPTDCYDFDSYEIYIGETPYSEGDEIIDRSNYSSLALPFKENYTFTPNGYLQPEYFIQVRVRDKVGNYSDWTFYHYLTGAVELDNYFQVGIESTLELTWNTEFNNPYNGFKIYRKLIGEEFDLLATYENDPSLQGVENDYDFEYSDSLLIPDTLYQYQISYVADDQEYFFDPFPPIRTNLLHKLYISDYSETAVDTLYFGEADYNLYQYHITKSYEESEIFSGFKINNNYCKRLFFERFDHAEESISILLALENNTENDTLRISADYQSDLNDLFLWEHATDNYYPLAEAEVLLEVNYPEVEDNWSLVWGDLRPDISFNPTASNYIVGNQLELDLDFFAGNLIEEYSLYLETDSDQILLGTYNEVSENITLDISTEMLCNRGTLSCEFVFNGNEYSEFADYQINILPADYTINYPTGWSLSTYYDNTTNEPEDAFAGLEDIIGWSSGYYIPSEIYFADSFWLHLEQTENYLFSQATGISVQSVEPGWNLYSNQAWINIAKENLTFNISGNIYNYQELYEMGICPYEIIGYRDGKYLSIDSINVGEAFWFYFYPTVELDNFYLADLFPDNPELPDQIAEITSLTAKYTDAEFPIKVGLNAESSDELDLYDSPTPPTPPFNQKQIYLTSDQPEIYQGKLATDFREFAETNTSYSWDFFIRHQDSEYATIEIEINENPEYNYYLRWGLDQFELANGSSLDLICFADEISSGQFIIVKALSGEEELSLDSDLSCYPNPFLPNNSRQGFQLQFSLQEPAKVELEIYNIKGQLVKTLINDKLEKGNHKSVWDGKDAAGKLTASGVYLIKLAKDNEITARKMLLLK